MATEQVFKTIITVLDRATAPLRAINAKITALGAPLRHVGVGLGELGHHSGLDRLFERTKGIGDGFARVGEHVKELLGPLALLGAAGSLGGLAELVKHAAEFGAQLFDASIKTGIATQELAGYHYAAQLAKVDVEAFDKSIVKLNRNLGDAATGKNKTVLSLMHKLGISVKDANGHVKGAAQLLPDLAEAFKVNEDAVLRDRMAFALFGKQGAELLPFLVKGREGLEKLTEEAKRLGLAPSDEDTERAEKFEKAQLALGAAVKGLGLAIGFALFEPLEKLITPLTAWIAANRELIATNVREFVIGIGDSLRNVDWHGVVEGARSFLSTAGHIITFMGGAKAVIAGVALVITGPLLSALVGLAHAFVSLGVAMVTTPFGLIVAGLSVIALAAYGVYTNWDDLKSLFGGPLPAALAVASAAFVAFGLTLLATPFGPVLLGIGAVAAALTGLYELYQHWHDITDPVKASVTRIPRPGDTVDPLSGLVVYPGTPSDDEAPAASSSSPPSRRSSTSYHGPLVGGLYGRRGAAQAPVAAPRGEVAVTVDITGAPPGTRVETRSSGVKAPETNVGYAFPGY